MYYAKKILVKSAISLFAGVASAIGMQVGTAIWNECANIKTNRKTKSQL